MKKIYNQIPRILLLAVLLFSVSFAFSQKFTVTGKIIDATGQPVSGATVTEKGTTNGTQTKNDGTFSIPVNSGNATLVISHIGYDPQEIAVGNQHEISVSLKTAANSLNEVVVVGYGTQRKSDVTGSLSRITAETLEERPSPNILQAMQGKAAGVHISSNLKPGELPVVRVRGNRSINASNDPLYVVDGIPMVNALGVTSFSMADLNTDDIASIEILKDASATAIYGSRGANGVVLITTKKAKPGRVTISYNATVSLDRYHSMTDWMTAGQYVDQWRQALNNSRTYNPALTGNTDFNKAPIIWYPNPKNDSTFLGTGDPVALANVMMAYQRNPDGSLVMRPSTAEEKAMGWPDMVPAYNSGNIPNYDWLGGVTRQGVTQSHQLMFGAGTATSRLSISAGYYNQLGVQSDQDYKRYNISLNGDVTATKWLSVGTSLITSLSDQNFGVNPPNTSNTGAKDLYSRAIDQLPFAQPYDANGNAIRNPGGNINLWNPIIDIEQVKNARRTTAIMSNSFGEVKFTPWLRYRLNFGAQYRRFRNGAWTGPLATSHLTNQPNTAGISNDDNFSWVAENLLYFDKTFANIHKVGLTFLYSAQKSRRESQATSISGSTSPLALWYDLASNSRGNPTNYSSGYTENTLQSLMGRLNYTLMNKYLLTASGRFDGASVLAPGHKWDFFPSFALAWKMQDEKFMNGITWINELKPRIGWGVVGNSSVAPYTTSGPLSRNPYVFGSAAAIGYLPQLAQNPDLKWERTAETNVGLDFGLFNSRISGSVELYKQTTTNLIFARPLNPVTGYVTKYENIGSTGNKGIEVTLSTINIRKSNFTWSTDFNWSRNKEEILELINGKQDIIASNLFIGQPTNVFYWYKADGIWGSDAKDIAEMAKFNTNGHKFYPGTVRIIDQNGDYKINASDFIVLGSATPKWTGGITNNFKYKNWTLNSFIYFRWGQMYFGGFPSYGGGGSNGKAGVNYWSWTNQAGTFPMILSTSSVENTTPAMQYNNGSFGVIRNISLSYTFTKNLLHHIAANDLTLTVQVLNPYLFGPGVVKWGINPDDDTNWSVRSTNNNPLGGMNNNTVLPQSFVFGIRAGF